MIDRQADREADGGDDRDRGQGQGQSRRGAASTPGPLRRGDGPGLHRLEVEEPLQVVGGLQGRRVAPVGGLLQALQLDGLEVSGDARPQWICVPTE